MILSTTWNWLTIVSLIIGLVVTLNVLAIPTESFAPVTLKVADVVTL